MRFRPCIDIHNGQVKQIVGGTLADRGDTAEENFRSVLDADRYAGLYRRDGLSGGHVILLNPVSSPYYEAGRRQVFRALAAYPGGLQAGGGIHDGNAADYLEAGASHVIVTSFLFDGGRFNPSKLDRMVRAVGRDRLVVDLSCRRRGEDYYVVTDRWQTFTHEKVTVSWIEELSAHCDEFLIHGVDAEGKGQGIEEDLLAVLSRCEGRPVTYAGGIRSLGDVEKIRTLGRGKIDFTVGSALDLFGGRLSYRLLAERYAGSGK